MSGIDVRTHARTGQLCLPDKEFRYLRTVIVTADIHGDFGSTPPQPLQTALRLRMIRFFSNCFTFP